MTIVPLELYFNPRGIAKLKLAVAEGKKLHDGREDAKNGLEPREGPSHAREGDERARVALPRAGR